MRKLALLACALSLPVAAWAAAPDLDIDAGEQAAFEEFVAAVQAMRGAAMRRGEAVAGWNVGAADPVAELRRRGAGDHYLLSSRPEDDSVSIVTDRAIADFVPDDWRIVDVYRAHDERRAGATVQFIPLSHRYVLAARAVPTRIGGVDCYGDLDHALLYERPGLVDSPADEEAPDMFRMMILAMEGQTVCLRYERGAQGSYISRSFTPDGHRLPALDVEGEEVRIVSAQPIDAYLSYRGPSETELMFGTGSPELEIEPAVS